MQVTLQGQGQWGWCCVVTLSCFGAPLWWEIVSVFVIEIYGHTHYVSAKRRTEARQHDNTTHAFTERDNNVTKRARSQVIVESWGELEVQVTWKGQGRLGVIVCYHHEEEDGGQPMRVFLIWRVKTLYQPKNFSLEVKHAFWVSSSFITDVYGHANKNRCLEIGGQIPTFWAEPLKKYKYDWTNPNIFRIFGICTTWVGICPT